MEDFSGQDSDYLSEEEEEPKSKQPKVGDGSRHLLELKQSLGLFSSSSKNELFFKKKHLF